MAARFGAGCVDGDDNGFTGARCDGARCGGACCLVNDTLDFNVAEMVVNGRTVVVVVVVAIAVIFFAVGFDATFGLNIGLNDSAWIICSNPVNAI